MKNKMISLLFVLFVISLSSCSTTKPHTPKEPTCYMDINRDSKCVVVDCEKIDEYCKLGNYRVLKIFPTKSIYVYSTNPKTDMKKCLQH